MTMITVKIGVVILCTISEAPNTLINHKNSEVGYKFSIFAYAQEMHFCCLKMQNIPCVLCYEYFVRRSTSENHTFYTDSCDLCTS